MPVEYLLAYGAMALAVAVLFCIDQMKSAPVRREADRFARMFLEARRSALGASPPLPAVETSQAGVRLLPEQAPPVRAALEAGAGSGFSACDGQMEQALHGMFERIGKSGHLKRHYFDYYNSLFVLQRLFMKACAEPDALFSPDDWKDLERYWANGAEMERLALERMSRASRMALPHSSA